MGNVLFIDVARREKNLTVQTAWEAYIAARDKAEKSRDVMDGVAAGKAWREFLELFAGPSK